MVKAAHARGLRVVVHALSDQDAARAAAAGADVLAHTPTEPLSESTLDAWGSRTIVSTLSAFGGAAARANLAALRARGARVLYGTDFGNTQVVGPSGSEIVALVAAGLDGRAVLASATREPASFWGLGDLGEIAAGRAASLLLLDADPLIQPAALAHPVAVWIDGEKSR